MSADSDYYLKLILRKTLDGPEGFPKWLNVVISILFVILFLFGVRNILIGINDSSNALPLGVIMVILPILWIFNKWTWKFVFLPLLVITGIALFLLFSILSSASKKSETPKKKQTSNLSANQNKATQPVTYFCKKCGNEFGSVSSLTNNYCSKGGYHELYDGPTQPKYLCEKCGNEFGSLSSLTSNYCSKGDNHEPFAGGVKSQYTCKKCGQTFSTLASLTSNYCSKGGNHEPAR